MLTLKMELAKVTVNTISPIDMVIAHLLFGVQFFGFPGSLGPSNSTKNLSGAGSLLSFVSMPFSTSAIVAPEISWRSSELILGASLLLAFVDCDWPEGVRNSGVLVAGVFAVDADIAIPCKVLVLGQRQWLGTLKLCSGGAGMFRVVHVVISGG